MIRRCNTPALQYWRYTTYGRAEVHSVCAELEHTLMLAAVDFLANDKIHVVISNRLVERKEGHAPAWFKFFNDVHKFKGRKPLRGSVLVFVEDGLPEVNPAYSRRAPILTFNNTIHDTTSFLIPDAAFMDSNGYEEDRGMISDVRKILPWDKRQSTIFWRGANSDQGAGAADERWLETPRTKLSRISKDLNRKEILDAAISKVVDYGSPELSDRVHQLGIVQPFLPFVNFLPYRYQVDLDGVFSAWISLFLKLLSGNVVLKAPTVNRQWYYEELQPWVHYVPMQVNERAISEVYEWLINHEDACKEIAENGRAVAEKTTYQSAVEETHELLYNLFECQTDRGPQNF